MSAFLSGAAGESVRAAGAGWLSGGMTVLVVVLSLVLLLQREVSRGLWGDEREERVRRATVVVVPVVLTAAVAVGLRLVDLVT